MSVTDIYDFAPPRLNKSATGTTVTRRLRAVCSDILDGVIAINAHADCPEIGDTYAYQSESDATLACTEVSIDPRADNSGNERYVFEITATYSNSVSSTGTGEDPENPLDDPATYEWSFNKYQVPATADRDGNGVVNGANESFDPPHMVDENRPVVVVTRNEASFSSAVAVEYQDTVNEFAWAGVDAGVAKINAITARSATLGTYSYYIVSYEIEFRWNGWNPTGILAQGYKYRKAASEPAQNYIDPSTGEPPSSPVLLALDGTLSPDPLGDGALPYFHEFNFYREKDFSALNLGL